MHSDHFMSQRKIVNTHKKTDTKAKRTNRTSLQSVMLIHAIINIFYLSRRHQTRISAQPSAAGRHCYTQLANLTNAQQQLTKQNTKITAKE